MARIELDGIGIHYELLGPPGAQAVAITPGGRFSMDMAGVRELGQALADGGRRVLLWDRPNTGASGISFAGPSESQMHGRLLIALIEALELGPTALAAGSAGSRVSLIAAAHKPSAISHLALWWISGGLLSLISLANYYCVGEALAANAGGMEAVAALPGWAEPLAKNPKNRDILLAQDPREYVRTMERWAAFYLPDHPTPVPGLTEADFATLTMPTLIYRSGLSDLSHTRATSERVHALIPGSELREPPWGDAEWNERSASKTPDGRPAHFSGWPALAPAILEFTAKH